MTLAHQIVTCPACGRLVNTFVNDRCPDLDCQEPLPRQR